MVPCLAMSQHTTVTPGSLARQLERVRRDDFATTQEEMALGACSVAVPVRDVAGGVVTSLGLVVPALRRDRERLVAALATITRGRRWPRAPGRA
jgi:DNA-binding IclR family transcriptional regulator